MFFPKTTFGVDISLEPKGANPREVVVTINAGEIPDNVIVASAIAGNSPRVRFQSQIRNAKGFPPGLKVEMSAEEWFGRPRLASKPRELTAEEIRAAALKAASENADERARLIADLQAMG